MIVRPGRWLLVLFAALLTAACREPTDDERLLELIDDPAVHLYAALKVVIVEPGRDPNVARARELLGDLAEKPGGPSRVRAADTLALGQALWTLRGIGKAEVDAGRSSKLPPLWVDGFDLPGTTEQLRATDHALLLLGLLVAKLHPKTPTPIPPPVLLYEAWMTGTEPELPAGLDPLARAAQAYAFASNELCDLATVHTGKLAAKPLPKSADAALRDVFVGLGRLAAHVPEAAVLVALVTTLPWWSRVLAHVQTARCLDGRDEHEDATVEWQRAVDVLESAGFPKAELAVLRAYVAYRNDDAAAIHEHLKHARESQLLDDRARKDLDALIEHYDPDNRSALSEFFDTAFLTGFLLKMTHQRLAQAGFYEALEELPVFEQARRTVASVGRVAAPAEGWWARVKAWAGNAW